MQRITIQDLAKLLSLNPSTVSRALSGHKDVNIDTRNRVLAAAKQFNYVPNLHARYFRKKNSGLIALILPDFNMFFTHSVMKGIHKALYNSGYTLIVFYTHNRKEEEMEIVKHCLSWVVEGILMIVSDETQTVEHLDDLRHAQVPVVLFDKVVFTEVHSTVTIDDHKAAADAVDYLAQKSCRSILGIFARDDIEITKRRLSGFRTASMTHQIKATSIHIQDLETIHSILADIEWETIDGAFIMSDELLFHSIAFLKARHLLPKITIIVMSDGVIPRNLGEDLAYIWHSGTEIGYTAANLLIKTIEQEEKQIVHLLNETSLFTTASQR
jgi:LacI family transcriptional regulator